MKKANQKKTKKLPEIDWAKVLAKPVTIDEKKLDDEELAEFLDWCMIENSTDFKMFSHLKKTGYFESNPITSERLAKAHMKKVAKKK
jgi:hypothetical protein